MTGTPPAIAKRLERDDVAWLTTLRPDGSPHVTPVWFLVADDTWWISSATSNVKVRNVVGDPRVAMALDGAEVPVVAEGVAVVHHHPFPASIAAGFAQKYGGWDIGDPDRDGPRCLIEITTTRWLLAGAQQRLEEAPSGPPMADRPGGQPL